MNFNELLGIKENYQMPERLREILGDERQREELFDAFLQSGMDLKEDGFNQYFQENHADRKSLMQDFTPYGIAQTISGMAGESQVILDICAGTGGLSIALWNQSPHAFLGQRKFQRLLYRYCCLILLFVICRGW